ncbi:MAG: 3-methyl-2-oxobutanoate dehydrogenase subunit beta, partial [Candidatus Omnitrophota bacterium]
GGGHGDYHSVVLGPASCQEMFDFTRMAFDIADRYRNTVIILGDGILGQMMEPIRINPKSRQAGKIGSPKPKKWALTGCKGRKPNIIKSLLLKEGALEELNRKLQKKFDLIKANEIRFEKYRTEDAEIIIVAYGTSSRISRACVDRLRKDGIKAGLFRPISLWPFPYNALRLQDKGKTKFLVVEMSAGQMLEDVKLAVQDDKRIYFYGRMGGGVPGEEEIIEKALKIK